MAGQPCFAPTEDRIPALSSHRHTAALIIAIARGCIRARTADTLLPVRPTLQWWMSQVGGYVGLKSGVLGDQHLYDQRFSRNAAFDDHCRRPSVEGRAFIPAAALTRTKCNHNGEGGWPEIEALSHVLGDLVERIATAAVRLVLDVDDLLAPFEMDFPRSPVGLAQLFGCQPTPSPLF